MLKFKTEKRVASYNDCTVGGEYNVKYILYCECIRIFLEAMCSASTLCPISCKATHNFFQVAKVSISSHISDIA